MSKSGTKSKPAELQYRFDVELSERELLSIGKIVALWGALEYEIFCQTLICFDKPEAVLPKEMNNLQFSEVLKLWEKLVIANAKSKRQRVLQQQHKRILQYQEYRNALTHGMWDWSMTDPQRITAVRVRKRQYISTHFTADDLASFVDELQDINFKLRYPGGKIEMMRKMAKRGHSESRHWVAVMTSNPVADELLPASVRRALEAQQEKKS